MRTQDTTGELNIKCDAKFYIKLATCGIYSDIQGRLDQWAHWAHAQSPRIFFLFEGPQLAVVK